MERRTRLLTVVSWLGGAASVLPFAKEWFSLSDRQSNVALLVAVGSAVLLGLLVRGSQSVQAVLERAAGPSGRPARALVLVALLASAGAIGMVGLTAVLGMG